MKVNLLQGIWQIDTTIIPSLQLIFTHRLQQLVARGYPTCNSVKGFRIKHLLSVPFLFTKLKILSNFLQTLVFKSLWSRTALLYLWLSVNILIALWLMSKTWKCHYSQLRAQKINSNNPKAIGLKLVELYVNNYKLKIKHSQTRANFILAVINGLERQFCGSLRDWGNVFFSGPPWQDPEPRWWFLKIATRHRNNKFF